MNYSILRYYRGMSRARRLKALCLASRAPAFFAALCDATRVDVLANAPRAVPHHCRDDDSAIAAAQVVDHVAGGDLAQLEHAVDFFFQRRVVPDILLCDPSAHDQG